LEKITRKSGFPPFLSDTYAYLILENQILRFDLINPATRKKILFEGFFNRNFGGQILLSENLYLKLELEKCELPKKLWPIGKIGEKEIIVNAAYAIVKIDSLRKIVVVETFKGNSKNFVGRDFIVDFLSTTMGPLG